MSLEQGVGMMTSVVVGKDPQKLWRRAQRWRLGSVIALPFLIMGASFSIAFFGADFDFLRWEFLAFVGMIATMFLLLHQGQVFQFQAVMAALHCQTGEDVELAKENSRSHWARFNKWWVPLALSVAGINLVVGILNLLFVNITIGIMAIASSLLFILVALVLRQRGLKRPLDSST